MFKKIIITILLLLAMPICCANPIENSLPMDKWSHIGAGYIINDQLHRHTHLTPLERTLTVFCIAYAKERWCDSNFDCGDIAATLVGAIVYQF